MNTQGPGTPFTGVGGGSWEAGVYDYRALPMAGSNVRHDELTKASWSYDETKKEMVSFDSEVVGRWKGEWIKTKGLGGAMFWELSGDKETTGREEMERGEGKKEMPGRSLIKVVKEAMGGDGDQHENWLKYEGSRYENMRRGM